MNYVKNKIMKTLKNNAELTINGRTISYIDYGSEKLPAIIFIHGFPFNKTMWQNLMEAFEDKYRILAYDMLGKNDCYDKHSDFSVEHFINDLVKLMNALKISKAILCGFSLGGFIALKAFENYPERFETLLINNHSSEDDSTVTKEAVIQAIENIKINGVQLYKDENLRLIFSPESMVNSSKEIASAWPMIVKSVAQVNFKTVPVETNPLRKFMRQYPAFIENN